MPEVLNIPIVESTASRYKPSNLTRVASIVVCFLFAALISTLTGLFTKQRSWVYTDLTFTSQILFFFGTSSRSS